MQFFFRRLLFLFLAALPAAAGCGGEPFAHVQVQGALTYEDGSPIPAERIELFFQPEHPPVDQKTHPRPGQAQVEADGRFTEVTTRKFNDGLVRGTHKVIIRAFDETGRQRVDWVPAEYGDQSTTPLTVDTANPQSFQIKIPKPSGGR